MFILLVNINVLVDEKDPVDVDNHHSMLIHNHRVHRYNKVSLKKKFIIFKKKQNFPYRYLYIAYRDKERYYSLFDYNLVQYKSKKLIFIFQNSIFLWNIPAIEQHLVTIWKFSNQLVSMSMNSHLLLEHFQLIFSYKF